MRESYDWGQAMQQGFLALANDDGEAADQVLDDLDDLTDKWNNDYEAQDLTELYARCAPGERKFD